MEVMTVVAILIIMASLAATFMVYGMGKARMNNAVFDAAALISTAQLRAISRGTRQYVFIYQAPNGQLHFSSVERNDESTPITSEQWNMLDLSNGPGEAINGREFDNLVLSVGAGLDANGLHFLDLDSARIPKPLKPPFQAIALTSEASNGKPDIPADDLKLGCNFCANNKDYAYGVLRFNASGTVDVMTGNSPAGAVIAFAPSGAGEEEFLPKLLTISAPAGAVNVF